MELKVAKLLSGDLIIGDYSVVDGTVLIKRPIYLYMTQEGGTFIDVIGTVSDAQEIRIPLSQVLYTVVPKIEVAEAYKSKTSPVKTPKAKKIIV